MKKCNNCNKQIKGVSYSVRFAEEHEINTWRWCKECIPKVRDTYSDKMGTEYISNDKGMEVGFASVCIYCFGDLGGGDRWRFDYHNDEVGCQKRKKALGEVSKPKREREQN